MAAEVLSWKYLWTNKFYWAQARTEKVGMRFGVVSSEAHNKLTINKFSVYGASGASGQFFGQVPGPGYASAGVTASGIVAEFTPKVLIGNFTPKDTRYNYTNPSSNNISDAFSSYNVDRSIACNTVTVSRLSNTSTQNYGNKYISLSNCNKYDIVPTNGPFSINPGERVICYCDLSSNPARAVINLYYGSPAGTFEVEIDQYPYLWRKFGKNQTEDPQGWAYDKSLCDGKWHLVRPFNVYRNGKWNNVEEL